MFANIYKKLIIDYSKITLVFLAILIIFSIYQSKNFNLDASSDALLLEGDPDLVFLSSEPYPFKEEHAFEIGRFTHHAKTGMHAIQMVTPHQLLPRSFTVTQLPSP